MRSTATRRIYATVSNLGRGDDILGSFFGWRTALFVFMAAATSRDLCCCHGFVGVKNVRKPSAPTSSNRPPTTRLFSDQVLHPSDLSQTASSTAPASSSSSLLFQSPDSIVSMTQCSIPTINPATSTSRLTPWERWCVNHIEQYYSKAMALKCPFMRRRAADLLDAADMLMRFLVIRHKSLELIGPPPSLRGADGSTTMGGGNNRKLMGLSVQETADIIRQDWKPETNKGYYITGRLNTSVYRDDCLFDGPDPDMPVKGLRKYLNAASQLFDQRQSRSELLSLEIDPVDQVTIVAKWRMHGILRLPWKPLLPAWTGTTRYHRDEDGLIYLHRETWDMSVFQAFLRTFWPALAQRIWCNNGVPKHEDISEDICRLDDCVPSNRHHHHHHHHNLPE